MEYLGTKVTLPTFVPPITAWLEHGPFAMWLVRRLKPNRIVELGTHYGYSYFAMCQAVLEGSLSTQCCAVDTWQGDEHAGFYDESVYNIVVQENEKYRKFSKLIRKTFAEALSDIEDGSVDLLHIDGRHFYDDVKEDFETWMPKLSPSAVVLFHDTEVKEHDFGVFRYWGEICDKRPSLNFKHCHGLGVLFWGDDLCRGVQDIVDMSKQHQTKSSVLDFFASVGSGLSEQHSLRDRLVVLQAELGERDDRLVVLQAGLGERDDRLVELDDRLAGQEAQLGEQDSRLAAMQAEIADLELNPVRQLRRKYRNKLYYFLARRKRLLPRHLRNELVRKASK